MIRPAARRAARVARVAALAAERDRILAQHAAMTALARRERASRPSDTRTPVGAPA